MQLVTMILGSEVAKSYGVSGEDSRRGGHEQQEWT